MQPATLQRTDAAADIARGVLRLFDELGYAGITEFSLASGRRADVIGLDDRSQVAIVEIKSCWTDFMTDTKWWEYGEYCDAFYFAVAESFPRERLPADVGLIVADRYGGAVLRPAPVSALASARRRALVLRLARVALTRWRMNESDQLLLAQSSTLA
jgi:hypothetical protein